MSLTLVTANRWDRLLDHLAHRLVGHHTDPFVRTRVVVSSRATGRIVGQEVAARLGISAGTDFLSPSDLMRHFAEAAGVTRDRSRWLGTPLDLAVWDAFAEIAPSYELVQRSLDAAETRPGRRRATASRLARLFRSYLDVSPDLVEGWLAGVDESLTGEPLPEHLAWQPDLLRAACGNLELDPTETLAAIVEAAAADATPSLVLAVDHFTAPQLQVLGSLAGAGELSALHLTGSAGLAWAERLADDTVELGGAPATVPSIEVHDSHGESRQVEVLRDALTRAFEEDPTLEPRDFVVVCPKPDAYLHLLDAAFSPGQPGSHPGRQLRVQPVGVAAGNPVLTLAIGVLRLGDTRATVTSVLDLLLSPPIAHRWHLTDRQAVIELVAGAGVHWGMDGGHRNAFGLDGIHQSTWMRGLDRLLVGLAVTPGTTAGLGISGTDAVGTSDMDVVGALCEVISRLRRFIARSSEKRTISEWVSLTREALDDLVGLPFDDAWQALHAQATLARFDADHLGRETLLTRHEFAGLLADAAEPPRSRVAAGNGSLPVVGLGELQHVPFKVAALLGVTDDVVPGRSRQLPESVDLGDATPNLRTRKLGQLLAHARSAEHLIVVRQGRSPHTNDHVAPPVALSWLFDELGVAPVPVPHPPTATAASNFTHVPSFDVAALEGAVARAGRRPGGSRVRERREAARRNALGAVPRQLTLAQLERFLQDPAKAFLRSALGVRLFQGATAIDDVPLALNALEHWSVTEAVLEAYKTGRPVAEVEQEYREREILPPGALGTAQFGAARREAAALWDEAGPDWTRPPERHAIDLELDLGSLGVVRLIDRITTRGGRALTVTPSGGAVKILGPWLEALTLTAAGRHTGARLHQLQKGPRFRDPKVPVVTDVAAMTAPEAHAHLSRLVEAYVVGQHRLIPAPADIAIRYADERASGPVDPAKWRGPIGGRYSGAWPSYGTSERPSSWQLFYEGDLTDLVDEPKLPTDPGNEEPSAFRAWATHLYAPLTQGEQ